MLFYLIGEFLQGFSIKRSRTSIKALLETHPDFANQVINGENKLVHPESLLVGDIIMVKPGEKIPIDGEIIRGNSQVDASPLTGESRPWVVKPGDMIYAGSMNITGLLSIEVVRPVADSSISRILELVESASNRKTQAEKFITKFAKVYSPIVVLIALGIAIFPPLIMGANFSEWLYRALVILVISCPCALVISIPLGYFGGVGAASRKGILVKGSNFLDILASVDTVVFDKTGTLTNGVFKVTQVVPRNGFSENELIFFAAQAEEGSNHPIATSIREAYRGKPLLPVLEQLEILGQGVQTTVGGRILLVGNDPLLHRENIIHDTDICNINGTVVHVAVDGKYAGFILISDEIKDDSIDAVQLLRSIGISRLVMLTGDNQETAAETASLLGMDDYEAALLPEGKINAVERILSKAEKPEKIAFIGDGINDAPALARADVGIAMGGLGSDVAIETADVVILADSPIKVAEAIDIGRKTRNIVYQNIILALAIKTGFIAMGVAGHASMWQAVFGDMGVALLALLNASRVFSKERVR
jgi:Cd2+/Zn2+-exporting ATPase